MANSGCTITVSLLVAAAAIGGGYCLSRKQKAERAKVSVGVELPLARISSYSLPDYCRNQGKTGADYLTVTVRGCPPRAPADVADLIEAVVDYRNCSGTALIPRQ
jgi:hypothetical protein